jgi:hypothetical protein
MTFQTRDWGPNMSPATDWDKSVFLLISVIQGQEWSLIWAHEERGPDSFLIRDVDLKLP